MSAESGISTFRDKDGIWSKVDYREVATPEGFAREPAQGARVLQSAPAQHGGLSSPMPRIIALARLEREFAGDFLLVTQNIDDLHERAGSKRLIHMHGELARALCVHCDASRRLARRAVGRTRLPRLRQTGGHAAGRRVVRRDALPDGRVQAALSRCDLFVSIGTSGTVYPAAGFVAEARAGRSAHGGAQPRAVGRQLFPEGRYGPATRIVPEFVDGILRGGNRGPWSDICPMLPPPILRHRVCESRHT